MKISTRLRLAVYVPALMALVIMVALVFSYQEMGKIQENGDTVRQIRSSITELNHFVFSYILYHEERPKQQFLAGHDTLTRLIASAQVQNPDQQRLLDSIREHNETMADLFLHLVSGYERDGTAGAQDRLVGLLLLRSYEADTDAALLRSLVDDGIRINGIRTIGLIFLVMALATVPLTIVLGRTRRSVDSSLSNLSKGTDVIGSGNLDFRIEEKRNDEIGDLSRAFNRMTANLKDVTTSKSILEQEMVARKKAEETISRQTAIVRVINRIFRECLTCDTKEELALFCLNAAEELTQSKFSFFGEIGADGLLHDTAMSNPGWESCAMHDKTGHRRQPGDFKIHGLYGRVLADGKGLLCNAPPSHPDSIGTPVGHPLIKAFLGVPLINGGKTIGMLGLANREGGYHDEDLAAMEALAPAIVEATMRKIAEENLRQSTAELEASNRELEAFSYSVSHDLRAPLRSMEGFSTALLEDCVEKLDEQGKQYLKHIQDSSELMARLIDDLLKLSRVTRSDMSYEKVNLSEIARNIVAELENAEPQHKVKLTIAPDITAYGDKNLLRLALDNLLGNAWKFSGKVDSPRIEMGTLEYNGKQAYFVRDNGVGFDMTYADKLFKPFQRLHKSTEFAGTGIGLATVQRIIRRHGGEVWAESKVGEGATFYFTLG